MDQRAELDLRNDADNARIASSERRMSTASGPGVASAGLAVAGLSFLVSAALALLLPQNAQVRSNARRDPLAISDAGGPLEISSSSSGALRDFRHRRRPAFQPTREQPLAGCYQRPQSQRRNDGTCPEAIRIEPAFEDRTAVRAMFARHAPYRAIGAYIPDAVVDDATKPEAEQFVQPWFRGNWAAGGERLVEGAEAILHNKQFLEAANTLFGTSRVFPELVVVNVNAPMSAGITHVDIPAFHGATRKQYPLSFLRMMGSPGLFEKWRVI
jgi:hypothetical protein